MPGKTPHPPRLPDHFLRWFCSDEVLETLQGDLYELYEKRRDTKGKLLADILYWRDVASACRPFAYGKRKSGGPPKRSDSNQAVMLGYYLKISWRSLLRNRAFSAINTFGLSLGITCFTIIALYVQGELSYDKFHHQSGNVYRVVKDFVNKDGSRVEDATTPPALAYALRNEVPEVEQVTRFFPGRRTLIRYNDKRFYELNLLRVDEHFFEVFDFAFVAGDKKQPFNGVHSMIMTETTARKYFGDESPIGKIVSTNINNDTPFVISGVVKDVPQHSHFSFDVLIPFESRVDPDQNWLWSSFYTYARLQDGADPAVFESKVQHLFSQHLPQSLDECFVQPITDIHLKSKRKWELGANGDQGYVVILSAIGLFVLIIAGVNYVNLVTAQIIRRAKAVAVRKVNGALAGTIFLQFLVESVLTVFISISLSAVLIAASIPLVQPLIGYDFTTLLDDKILLPGLLVLCFGVAAGIYPAMSLATLPAVNVLRGKYVSSRRGIRLRSGLVVFQFFISIGLIAGTLIITRQMHFMQQRRLGFNPENVITLPNIRGRSASGPAHLVEELRKIPAVVNVARADGTLGFKNFVNGITDKEQGNHISLNYMRVDYEFLPVMQIELLEGRNFSLSFKTDSVGIILNEKAAIQLGLEKPFTGRKLVWDGGNRQNRELSVVGVVRDFHFASLHEEIQPFGLILEVNNGSTFLVRIGSSDLPATLASVEEAWNRSRSDAPFEYSFQDQQMASLYVAEARFQKLFTTFAVLAICIACLGLFGLITSLAESKTKEIGIRKVLGCSVAGVVGLLSGEFIKLVGIGFLIAVPPAYLACEYWLRNFAYHVNPELTDFLQAGLAAVTIALVTTSFRAVKAALANPVNSLRSE